MKRRGGRWVAYIHVIDDSPYGNGQVNIQTPLTCHMCLTWLGHKRAMLMFRFPQGSTATCNGEHACACVRISACMHPGIEVVLCAYSSRRHYPTCLGDLGYWCLFGGSVHKDILEASAHGCDHGHRQMSLLTAPQQRFSTFLRWSQVDRALVLLMGE